MQFQERGQPSPDGGQCPDVGPVNLFQDREQPALFMMIVKDQLGDIHDPPYCTETAPALATEQEPMLRPGSSSSFGEAEPLSIALLSEIMAPLGDSLRVAGREAGSAQHD